MPPRRVAPLAALLLSVACASAPRATLESTRFAPQLEVDLAAMPEQGGVRYHDLAIGTGSEVRRGSGVAVFYAGWLTDGTPFDSLQSPAAPIRFRIGSATVIPGWERGLLGMHAGGRRLLVVPPALGYGTRGTAGVPPDAVLVFRVEVVDVR